MRSLAPLLASLRALPLAVRIGAAGAGVLLAAFAVCIVVAAHPESVPLFAAPLRTDQVDEVQEQLAAWHVQFSPSTDNVLVASAQRGDLLLRLALAGVPRPHVATSGEALANVGVLTPQSVIDAQARAGLAGDIELALRSVEGIEAARVIVAPAANAEFADQQSRPAGASVRLELRPGAILGREAISGIRRFVASAVPGLDPANVTLLDDRGIALGTGSDSDDAPGLERSLQSALDAALGASMAIVRVHVDAGGRISSAILVDARRDADLAAVRAIAAAAVGYDPRRGDALTVDAVIFHRALEPKRDLGFFLYGAIASALPTLAVVAALLVGMRFCAPHVRDLVRSLIERESIIRTSRAVAGYAPARVRGALANEPPHAAAAIISALPAATAAAVLELYPPHEREAIVTRMQRAHGAAVPSVEEVLGRHA
jgi:flagellar biosynthesis/type III secretory pathway M-ring protein FliF/YscJ